MALDGYVNLILDFLEGSVVTYAMDGPDGYVNLIYNFIIQYQSKSYV